MRNVALMTLLVLGACAALPGTALSETSADLTPVFARYCYVDESRGVQTLDGIEDDGEEVERPVVAVHGPVVCLESDGVGPTIDATTLDELFPELYRLRPESALEAFAVVQCGDRGQTAVQQTRQQPNLAPAGVKGLRRGNMESVLKSCADSLGVELPGRGEWLNGLVDLGRTGPSASSVSCTLGSATDPLATGSSRNDSTIGGTFFDAGWAIYTGIIKTVNGIKDFDLTDLREVWNQYDEDQRSVIEKAAEALANSAADGAEEMADQADYWAGVGEARAQQAKNDPSVSPERKQWLDERAADAAYWATVAREHATNARDHANQAGEARTYEQKVALWAKAQEEEKKAREAAKKAEDAGRFDEKPSDLQAPGDGNGSGGANERLPEGNDPGTSCSDLQSALWECEQAGWKTGPCLEFLNKLNGCADMTIVNPGPEGAVTCATPQADPETVERAVFEACGAGVAQPGFEGDLSNFCNQREAGAASDVDVAQDCDPTIAIAEMGCPQSEIVTTAKDDTVCIEPAPGTAPLPCVDPTPEPPGGEGGTPTLSGADGPSLDPIAFGGHGPLPPGDQNDPILP